LIKNDQNSIGSIILKDPQNSLDSNGYLHRFEVKNEISENSKITNYFPTLGIKKSNTRGN